MLAPPKITKTIVRRGLVIQGGNWEGKGLRTAAAMFRNWRVA